MVAVEEMQSSLFKFEAFFLISSEKLLGLLKTIFDYP